VALCKKPECVAKSKQLNKRVRQAERSAVSDGDTGPKERASAVESDEEVILGAQETTEPVTGTVSTRIPGILETPFVTAVLPTHDREAPYGRDLKTDLPLKPIRMHRSDLVDTSIDITRLCPHRNNPSTCFLCVAAENLKTVVPNPRRETPVPKPPVPAVTEDSVRKVLGIEPNRRILPVKPAAKSRSNGSVRYRDVLGLTEENLLMWLELEQVRYGHPGITTLEYERKPKRIAPDYDDTPVIEHQKQIQDLEGELNKMQSDLAYLRSAAYDGGLSPQRRPWAKKGLEKSIKEMKNEIGGMKRRKVEARRRSRDECWVFVEIPGTLHEVVRYPGIPSITEDDARCYREVVNLTRAYSKEWRDFENKVIVNAIKGWVFAALKSVVREHLDLRHPMYGIPRSRVNVEGLDSTFDAEAHENSLIAKTGGDQIGGSIISAGINSKGRSRGLSSFEGSQHGIARGSGSGSGSGEEGMDGPDYDVSDDSVE
jgi:hypothetical protein